MSYTKLTWKCGLCGDTITSYSNERWSMDFCSCGESAVDLEEQYQRNIGNIIELKREVIYKPSENRVTIPMELIMETTKNEKE